MVIKTIVAVAYLAVCVVVMNKMFWMLELCVPSSQEPEAKARARRWKKAVAAVVVGAWLCAACVAFGFDMPKMLCAVVLTGPIAISLPVLAWVLLIY